MPSDWIDDAKLSALTARLRNVGSETADQAAEAIGALWRHIKEQDDTDARRLDWLEEAGGELHRGPTMDDEADVRWWLCPDTPEIAVSRPTLRAAIDAAMAADTQTPTED